MHTPDKFVPCPECACFLKQHETSCPHCGSALAPSPARKASSVATALMMGVAFTACVGGGGTGGPDDTGGIVALYGVADTSAMVDRDGDGFSPNDGDCNDDDASIHPDATETAGDSVDSNCDGADDT